MCKDVGLPVQVEESGCCDWGKQTIAATYGGALAGAVVQPATLSAGGTPAWKSDSGQLIHTLEHNAPLISAAFSPDGRTIITAGDDGMTRIWDVESGMESGRLLSCINGGWIAQYPGQPLRYDAQGEGLQALAFVDPAEPGLPTLWEAEDLQAAGLLPADF